MIIESFPAITMATVELEPANPQLRGRKLPSLKDRLKFGGPLFARITTDYHPDDADLQAFLHGSQERWVLAHLALGFPSSDGPPLATASVQVNLGDDGEPAETIAFSILPVAAGTPYEESEKFTINPHATVGHTVGISLGSFGRETVRRGQEVCGSKISDKRLLAGRPVAAPGRSVPWPCAACPCGRPDPAGERRD